MPIRLTTPKQIAADVARVSNLDISVDQGFVSVQMAYGRLLAGGGFEEEPTFGKLAFMIKNGVHPRWPSMSLGKCSCGAWSRNQPSGACPSCSDGTVVPYDGFDRLIVLAPQGASIYEAIANSVYAFLASEIVPDPDSWELVRLVEGSVEP